LEIRAAGPRQEPAAVAVTMRTPGNDFELAAGFLLSEGLIAPGEIRRIRYCVGPDGVQEYNVVTVESSRRLDLAPRRFVTTSSCGICGKATLDEIAVRCPAVTSDLRVASDVVLGLPDELRRRQRVFDQTGGLHASGLFDADGRLRSLREDVG